MIESHSSREKKFRLPRVLELLFGIIIVLELVAPFVAKIHGFDAHLHLLWLRRFYELNASGILIPTWDPAGFYSFGSVAFYFYAPFTYALGSIVHTATRISDPYTLYWIIGYIGTLGSFFSARWLMRLLNSSTYLSNLGAAIFAFAPLRAFDLYNRSALSTHLAYVFLPIICGAFIMILQGKNSVAWHRIILISLSYALLLLTSVPIAFAVVVAIGIACAVNWRNINIRVVIEGALACGMVASLVFFHFGSVLSSRPYLRLSGFRLVHSARDIFLWFQPGSGTYEILLIYGSLVVLTIAYHIQRGNLLETEKIALQTGLAIAAFVLFLDLSPLSAYAWNHASLLQYIQFPWRFYSFMLLFFAVAIAVSHSEWMTRGARIILTIWIVGAILPMVLVLTNFLNHPIALEEDSLYAPTSPVQDVQTVLLPHKNDPPAVGHGVTFNDSLIDPYHEVYRINLNASDTITFHRFNWPFWHLHMKDREIPSWSDSLGRAVAILPTGKYEVDWTLERTPLETAGFWISGFAWGGVIITSGIGLVRRRVRRTRATSPV